MKIEKLLLTDGFMRLEAYSDIDPNEKPEKRKMVIFTVFKQGQDPDDLDGVVLDRASASELVDYLKNEFQI